MTRAAIFCPGRGSYTERSLGSLPPDDPLVERAEEMRAAYDLEPLLALDGAERFSPSRHLPPSNVSPLIYVASVLDAEQAKREHEVVCVGGNSLGWYTALAVAGAVSFEDGFRLVQEMSLLQEKHGAEGGQVLYPLVDDDWRALPERAEAVERALASSEGEALPSIELGGYVVLAGTERGVRHLLTELPKVKVGATPYPFRLMQHGPYHTRFVESVASRARESLKGVELRAPELTLVDGRGKRYTPWSADWSEMREYTLGEQVVSPFSFTRTVRVALRELAPDRVVLPGPGNTLGGVVGQVLAMEGWRGIRGKADFERVQSSDEPVVVSMRR